MCKRCRKPRHITPNFRVKLVESEVNAVYEANETKWEKCLSVE